ncbi:MAG: radical SAM protein [Candidatus Omnitrophota bacterium]|nr:radical SAM protein [Candidatus Omnitrophota bacterium]
MDHNLDYSKSPKVCSIQIVNTCFMKCKMCYSWQKQKDSKRMDKELNIAEWESFLDSLREITPAGTPVSFTGGGEPLYREGIFELIEYATKKGFIAQLPSNGYLIDQDIAKRLADAGLCGLTLSLDSLNEKTHDFLRGVDGTFLRVMKAIGYLRRNKIGFSLMTTIMEKNLNDILELVDWAKKERIGIRFQAVSRPFDKDLACDWHEQDEWKFLWPQDNVKAARLIDELISLKNSGYEILNPVGQLEIFKAYFEKPRRPYRLRRCNVGDYLMNMDIFGNLNPCYSIGIWGNIKETKIRDLWFSQKAQAFREEIYNCQKPCHHLINCFYEE